MRRIFVGLLVCCLCATPVLAENKGAHIPKGARIIKPKPALKVIGLQESSKEPAANIDSVKSLQEENSKLKEELSRRMAELREVQVALASTHQRAKRAEEDRKRMEEQLKLVNDPVQPQAIPAMEAENLLSLVDAKGDSVFFNGVGEARMITTGDTTVLRFPAMAVARADKVLAERGASRVGRGKYVYYTIASNLLAY